ncbi:MAG: DEAD/DEAH box helicase family protein [Thermoguttaceae bacterium]|nr:DEAD/DEAH box helicase family protein [Thermoguttaceae bacterium]
MNDFERLIKTISARLSLRAPQREALEILKRVCETLNLSKDADVAQNLETLRREFPAVESFERAFPSLCFALATGVGKTRLMGAFIAFLYQAGISRHFFVIAPNLTVYEKLSADFKPGTPKYVFRGIGEFGAENPVLVTGDNYGDGRGAKERLFNDACFINVFNISKINGDKNSQTKIPRFKRLSEYIGQSYSEYLAGLNDLVVLMDESHHYRASAGVQAIEELRPLLGLELTATPQVEKGSKSIPFKNVVYEYPLATAIEDGFVKEPAVATRENFDPSAYSPQELEKIKLEDGVRVHENVKIDLQTYALERNERRVKPFMLVVAADVEHANELQAKIESDDFFNGRYCGKTIQVHSNLKGSEREEVVARLLQVENPAEPTEIVIHVNMLKEGWDVSNLYTIVPLRAANSKTLVEQSIGRGLRLPYGRRTGVDAVDRLTIVSHDRFKEIVDYANDPNSVIRRGVVIGRDIPDEERKILVAAPKIETLLGLAPSETRTDASEIAAEPPRLLFETPAEIAVARQTYALIGATTYARQVKTSRDLTSPKILPQIVADVKKQTALLGESLSDAEIETTVKKTLETIRENAIDIPRIVVTPKDGASYAFEDFDLDVAPINLQPVAQDILIKYLGGDQESRKLSDQNAASSETRFEDYLVAGLIDYNDVCYDDCADLLYKLAGQAVARLREYLADEAEVLNVLQYYRKELVEFIHAQMTKRRYEPQTEYEVKVLSGVTKFEPQNSTVAANERIRNFRAPLGNGETSRIKSTAFGGFRKCVYDVQKFDSRTELELARVLEDDPAVVKWLKPTLREIRIFYAQESSYLPDFIVETADAKYLCETKRASELDAKEVTAKRDAAVKWARLASENDDKPWKYLLIPHDQTLPNMTLAGLAAKFEQR